MEDEVISFIHRRFPSDSNWTNGNCYHFALILSNVFNGVISYDPIQGHFFSIINNKCYDWTGEIARPKVYYPWNILLAEDPIYSKRLWKECAR